MDWILTQQANFMLAIVIIFQAFLLGAEVSLELESQHAGQKHMPLRWSIAFEFLDIVLLLIFSVEYLLRSFALRLTYVFSWLGGIDLMLLLTGVFSTVVISMEMAFGDVSGTLLSTVHSVRRLRILRIARLLQIFPALQVLIKGLIGTMIAIADSMILICLMSFVGALLCCEALGDEKQSWELRNLFGSVPGSFLIHIQLVLVEAWPDIASVMMTNSPFWGIYVIVFVALSNFTVLNVVTGVVCDAVLELACSPKPPMSMEQQQLKFESLKDEIEDIRLETTFPPGSSQVPQGVWVLKSDLFPRVEVDLQLGDHYRVLVQEVGPYRKIMDQNLRFQPYVSQGAHFFSVERPSQSRCLFRVNLWRISHSAMDPWWRNDGMPPVEFVFEGFLQQFF